MNGTRGEEGWGSKHVYNKRDGSDAKRVRKGDFLRMSQKSINELEKKEGDPSEESGRTLPFF